MYRYVQTAHVLVNTSKYFHKKLSLFKHTSLSNPFQLILPTSYSLKNRTEGLFIALSTLSTLGPSAKYPPPTDHDKIQYAHFLTSCGKQPTKRRIQQTFCWTETLEISLESLSIVMYDTPLHVGVRAWGRNNVHLNWYQNVVIPKRTHNKTNNTIKWHSIIINVAFCILLWFRKFWLNQEA